MSSFNLLAPFIQSYIYRNRWSELRDIQDRAISAILESNNHVLISAGTASGKTEAAFFPVLSRLWQEDPDSFGVIYIGPLKALINDQFERLTNLIEDAEIPIYAWHGDRSSSEKKRAMNHPKGILQITPESLEALLMNHLGAAKRMFQHLQFIIIDEIHAFMGSERGMQLQCQLNRIDRITGRSVRRIGLSATIQNLEDALHWLGAGSPLPVQLIQGQSGGKKLLLSFRHDEFPDEDEKRTAEIESDRMNYLYNLVSGRKCLVFTVSRMDAEKTAFALKGICEERKDPGEYYVHHGSISSALRGETEGRLRESKGPVTAVATKTLELGIDLGSLERVIQLGTPDSCSSFVQRLGRTGRRDQPAVMGFMTSNHPNGKNVFDDLPWEMLKSIAMIQLYLEEKWVEPFYEKTCPYSILFHQTLSALMQKEMSGSELAQAILTLPAFQRILPEDYILLLRHMQTTDIIEKTEIKTLIPGLLGEKLAGYYEFFSVFPDQSGFSVIFHQKKIGEVDNLPELNETLALAGQNWRVTDIDQDRKKIFVLPSQGKTRKQWTGGAGVVHDRILQRIRQILTEETEYPYLDHAALETLRKARKDASAFCLSHAWTVLNNHHFLLHPWLGTRKMITLLFLMEKIFSVNLQLQSAVINPAHTGIYINSELPMMDFISILKDEIAKVAPEDLIPLAPANPIDKYDEFIPEYLIQKAYIYDTLDIVGLKQDTYAGKLL